MNKFKSSMSYKLLFFILVLGLSSNNALSSEFVITEKLIRSILKETNEAAIQNDFYGLTKYYYPGTVVVYDLDPDPQSEKIELGYDDFMPKMKLDLAAYQEADTVEDEILKIEVHEDGKSGESITRTKIVRTLNGVRTEVIGDIRIRYVIVNGEIKIAREEAELIKYENKLIHNKRMQPD